MGGLEAGHFWSQDWRQACRSLVESPEYSPKRPCLLFFPHAGDPDISLRKEVINKRKILTVSSSLQFECCRSERMSCGIVRPSSAHKALTGHRHTAFPRCILFYDTSFPCVHHPEISGSGFTVRGIRRRGEDNVENVEYRAVNDKGE